MLRHIIIQRKVYCILMGNVRAAYVINRLLASACISFVTPKEGDAAEAGPRTKNTAYGEPKNCRTMAVY